MKHLKTLGLAAAAAMALAAFFAAGSATATVICENNETANCATPWAVNKAIELDMSLVSGTTAKLRDPFFGTTVNTCTESTVKMLVERGTPNAATPGGAGQVAFGTCTEPVAEVTTGEIEIHSIAGSDQGTVTAKGFALTFEDPFGNMCAYGAGAGLDVGRFIPAANGLDGTISINVNVGLVAAHSDSGCAAALIWTANYTQTSTTLIKAISAS